MSFLDKATGRLDRESIAALQPLERDNAGQWRPMNAPLSGLALKMNLRYIYRVGFTAPNDVSEGLIDFTGYSGAIQLKNGVSTYLYRQHNETTKGDHE